MRVRVEEGKYESLAGYSKLSGVSVEDLVDEALANFIEADLASRLEAYAIKSANA